MTETDQGQPMRRRFNSSRKSVATPNLVVVFSLSWLIGLVLCPARATDAAFLSEIWLASATVRMVGEDTLQPIGPLIEIAGIGLADPMEIVIVDATAKSANFGRILQVIPFTPNSQVHVITGSQNDRQLSAIDPNPNPFVASDLADEPLAFRNVLGDVGRRSVLLFDRWTGLTPLDGRIQDVTNPSSLNANIVDVVTFGDPGRTQPRGLEAVLDPANGGVFVRPVTPLLEPSSLWLAGPVDRSGRLTGDAQGYPTSPGQTNAVLMPGQIPEPTSASVWSLLVMCAGLRRVR